MLLDKSLSTTIPDCAATSLPDEPSRRAETCVWATLLVGSLAGLSVAVSWPMGTPGRPGPGAFAVFVLALLALLSALRLYVCLRPAIAGKQSVIPVPDRSVWLLLCAPSAFAALVAPAGFLVAGVVAGWFAARAAGTPILKALVIGLVLTALVYALFRFGLSVPLDLWGVWFI